MWNGSFFESATLEDLGFVRNLGHPTDVCPGNPETQRILVVDLSGYHYVRVRFCACSHSSFLHPYRQLLRIRWYPASSIRPRTVFTFDLLDTYHKISMQGKLNLYDFYTAIMQKTDNRGRMSVKVCRSTGSPFYMAYTTLQYRYHEISRCVRQWRHIKDIKRGAVGHTPTPVDDLADGALAIECPACPHPGRNLPSEWQNESGDKAYTLSLVSMLQHSLTVHCRWLYSLFIAIDANFKLKSKTRGIKDPELGSGLAYFVNAVKFEAHLKSQADEEEVSVSYSFCRRRKFSPQQIETCGTEFHAVNQANSKRSKSFTVSGVGAVVCRHGLVRKNGVVDLQKGER